MYKHENVVRQKFFTRIYSLGYNISRTQIFPFTTSSTFILTYKNMILSAFKLKHYYHYGCGKIRVKMIKLTK